MKPGNAFTPGYYLNPSLNGFYRVMVLGDIDAPELGFAIRRMDGLYVGILLVDAPTELIRSLGVFSTPQEAGNAVIAASNAR